MVCRLRLLSNLSGGWRNWRFSILKCCKLTLLQNAFYIVVIGFNEIIPRNRVAPLTHFLDLISGVSTKYLLFKSFCP